MQTGSGEAESTRGNSVDVLPQSRKYDDFKEMVMDLVGKLSIETEIRRKISTLESLLGICSSKVQVTDEILSRVTSPIPPISISQSYKTVSNQNLLCYHLSYSYNKKTVKQEVLGNDWKWVYEKAMEQILNERSLMLWSILRPILRELIENGILPWELIEELSLTYPDGSTKKLSDGEIEKKQIGALEK